MHGLLWWYVIADNFFWKDTGKKRYQNDTRTIPQNTIWEPLAGGHPPTHTLEQNIDTLSALVQRIPIPYFMSGSNSLKRGKEEPNKATNLQHHHGNVHLKMQIRWIDQIQYPISLVASLDTVPMTCWNSTNFTFIGKAHAYTHKQTQKRTFSSSTFGCKDFKRGEWGAFVEFGPSSYALFIAGRKTWKTTVDVIVTFPCKNASES